MSGRPRLDKSLIIPVVEIFLVAQFQVLSNNFYSILFSQIVCTQLDVSVSDSASPPAVSPPHIKYPLILFFPVKNRYKPCKTALTSSQFWVYTPPPYEIENSCGIADSNLYIRLSFAALNFVNFITPVKGTVILFFHCIILISRNESVLNHFKKDVLQLCFKYSWIWCRIHHTVQLS